MSKKIQETQVNSLFPDFSPVRSSNETFIRDERHMALFPLCYFGKEKIGATLTLKPYPNTEYELISNPEDKSEIPRGRHLDYLYALLYLLAEKTHYTFKENIIYFTANEAISAAGKKRMGEEYKTLEEALHYYYWLGIKSTVFYTVEGGKKKPYRERVRIIEEYSVVGGATKKGRKKSHTIDAQGYYRASFTDFIMNHLRSAEMSSKLNFSFMMKLSGPLAKRYYRLLNVWRAQEEEKGKDVILSLRRNIYDIAWQLPLASRKPAVIKNIIEPLHAELIELSYLHHVDYVREGDSVFVEFYFSEFTVEQAVIYTELIKRGIAEKAAKNFAIETDPNLAMDIIRYCDLKRKEDKSKSSSYLYTVMKNPQMSHIRAFLDEIDHKAQRDLKQKKDLQTEKLKMVYDQHLEAEIDKAIKHLTAKEKKKYLEMAEEIAAGTPQITRTMLQRTIDLEFRRIVQTEKVSVLPFNIWLESSQEQEEGALLE